MSINKVNGDGSLSILADKTQVNELPVAAAQYFGMIYQYTGATDSNYTNGYFYKCISDGELTPTYSWEVIETEPTPYFTYNSTTETLTYVAGISPST